ncbi:hypothetical protein [Paraburkholderia humisilvae]|uniref:Uncharacterized protein n=1 Tax=Paraburkholderia humisilvae TaxID=627669 RepID=A0A6J5DYZ5_9BURK|nr:hypothetical protein [Paraburkholderia humisilvae]CAB3758684.1 hypothetical protein LMG29542_03404 [Paraburkholderia humisilvae]
MCYGKPEEMLADFLQANPLVPNDLGHTALDDFDHFCAYSGCNPTEVGPDAYAWAKLAYVSARASKT